MSLAVLGLLVLLDEIAATTAACSSEIDKAAALKVVLLAEVSALESERDPVKTEAGRAPEEEARGVDGLVSLKVTVLSETVMGLAKGHTRDAAGDRAKADGAEAAKEAVLPRLRRQIGRAHV